MPSPAAASDIYMTTNAYSIPMANAVLHPVTSAVMSYEKLITDPATKATWTRSAANEFGRLAQGVGGRITGTDTIKFISMNDVPKNRTVTYARFVCDYRPQKTEPERTRLTVGGNLIDYPGDVATSTADITTAKLVWNSVISTDNAQFMGMDIKNFYLNTPMDHPEYMRIHLRHIPDEIVEEYGLLELAHEGFVYVEINKGMYGLPQASILANKLLVKHLARNGYFQCRHAPGLWSHTFRLICFALVVDDFGVKYVGRKHAEHLLQALRRNFEAISCDWNGELFCGITLKWDYDNRTVDLSMPKYIEATLLRFQHSAPSPMQQTTVWSKGTNDRGS
jgi:hypothetical protein